LNKLAWIWTHYREVESDMSVLHRIDDSPSYPDSARWFERAEQLVHYPGAVRAAGMREASATPPEPEFNTKNLPWVQGPVADNWGPIASHVVVSDAPPRAELNLTESDRVWLDSVDVHDVEGRVSDA
jgi:hypothetical protein